MHKRTQSSETPMRMERGFVYHAISEKSEKNSLGDIDTLECSKVSASTKRISTLSAILVTGQPDRKEILWNPRGSTPSMIGTSSKNEERINSCGFSY